MHWANRSHFFAISAQIMRRILIDHARRHAYAKRGGGAQQVSLEEVAAVTPDQSAELVRLDEALKSLAEMDPRRSQVVELRYFGGLNNEEIAGVLNIFRKHGDSRLESGARMALSTTHRSGAN